MLEKKLKVTLDAARGSNDELTSLKGYKERFEGRNKVLEEQLALISKNHEDTVQKKGGEIDLLMKELAQVGIKEKDAKQTLQWSEKELNDLKDHVRQVTNELDTRTAENDHLISLLEEQEQRLANYEQREKAIQTLATESRKRIEDANLERDRVQLKEAQYLRQIERLEETLETESKERKERHDRLIEALREKQKAVVDSRDDEINELKMKLGETLDQHERLRVENESLQKELTKMLEQWKNFKEDAS